MKRLISLSIFISVIVVLYKQVSNVQEPIAPIQKKKISKETPRPFVHKTKIEVGFSSMRPKKTQTIKTTPHLKPKKNYDPKEFVPFDQDGNIYVSHVEILLQEKLLIGFGDLIVGNFEEREDYLNGDKPLIIPPPKLWDKGIVPYEIGNFSDHMVDQIKTSIGVFNKETGLVFRERTFEDKDYIHFEGGSKNCYSRLGKTGGEQIISLSEGCNAQKISHEIMHALGFLHEQNREDRDKYLQVLWQNIDPEYHIQFKKIPNILMLASKTKFSYHTIMLYPSTAFSIDPQDYSIVTSEGDPYGTTKDILNLTDINRIKLLYKEELAKN